MTPARPRHRLAALQLAAVLVAAAAQGGVAQAQQLEQSRGFCAAAPLEPDISVPESVNALGYDATTPPVAVLDTGADPQAPELAGRVTGDFDALGGIAGGDVDGHGTQVAGMVAAAPGLVRGVSPGSPVMPIRVYNLTGGTSIQAIATGIRHAAEQGATAIVISGTDDYAGMSATDLATLRRATSEAFNRGALVIAGSGNDGAQIATFPSALPHVLGVGGSDTLGVRMTSSNTGIWVDLVAPGSSLTLPMPKVFCESGYGLANGTSFAAGAVGGAAALLAAARPELTQVQRFEALRTSARDVSLPGRDDETGFGMLDVGAALAARPAAAEPSPEVDDDPFFVRGPFASKHPVLLRRSRKARIAAAHLSRAKDPADVYPIRVPKNERLVVRAKATGKESVMELSLWRPTVGDFDVSNETAKQRIVSTGGFAVDPVLKFRSTKTGTYYVSIEVPDALDEDDPTAPVLVTEPYTLSASRTKIPKRKTKPKKRTTKKSAR